MKSPLMLGGNGPLPRLVSLFALCAVPLSAVEVPLDLRDGFNMDAWCGPLEMQACYTNGGQDLKDIFGDLPEGNGWIAGGYMLVSNTTSSGYGEPYSIAGQWFHEKWLTGTDGTPEDGIINGSAFTYHIASTQGNATLPGDWTEVSTPGLAANTAVVGALHLRNDWQIESQTIELPAAQKVPYADVNFVLAAMDLSDRARNMRIVALYGPNGVDEEILYTFASSDGGSGPKMTESNVTGFAEVYATGQRYSVASGATGNVLSGSLRLWEFASALDLDDTKPLWGFRIEDSDPTLNYNARGLAIFAASATPASTNMPPIAHAGPDLIIDDWIANGDGKEIVPLRSYSKPSEGSLSYDPDGFITDTYWYMDGVEVAHANYLSYQGSLDSNVELDVGGPYTLTLYVVDDQGAWSVGDDVQITVRGNIRANAGPDQHLVDSNLNGAETVTLDASGTTVPNATITNYVWLEGRTEIAQGPTPQLVLPTGWHSLMLEVTDSLGRSQYDVVNILITQPFTADIYVDPIHGSDSSGDGTSGNPYQSIGQAFAEATEGDVIALEDGNYGTIGEIYGTTSFQANPAPFFTDWVTVRAAPGAQPVADNLVIGARAGAEFDGYVHFQGLTITGGVTVSRTRHLTFEHCRISMPPPYVGSPENIKKMAMDFSRAQQVDILESEITDCGTGIHFNHYGNTQINIFGNHIHRMTQDGIQVFGNDEVNIEANHIHHADDGVADAEASNDYDGKWSFHADLIHVSKGTGGAVEDEPAENITIANNILYYADGQTLIVNAGGSYKHKNIVIDNNVLGPSLGPMCNLADNIDGLVFRNNTVDFAGPVDFHRWTIEDYNVRVGNGSYSVSNVEIYNNILYSIGFDDVLLNFFDYNYIMKSTGASVLGYDLNRGYGRFTLHGPDPGFVHPGNRDGVLDSSSPVIHAATSLLAPDPIYPWDIYGTPRDHRPDMGAFEYPGLSPDPEPVLPVYNDTKTRFREDFEDGHYHDSDPWFLQFPNTQGLSWYRPEGFDDYIPRVQYTPDYAPLHRNTLRVDVPNSSAGLDHDPWLIGEQGSDWVDYTLEFDIVSFVYNPGEGPCVLVQDTNNYYFIDIAPINGGKITRFINGQVSASWSVPGIQADYREPTAYKINVTHVSGPDGIRIDVDKDNDGGIDGTITDNNAVALATFSAGTIALHAKREVTHGAYYDNIEVNVSTLIGGGLTYADSLCQTSFSHPYWDSQALTAGWWITPDGGATAETVTGWPDYINEWNLVHGSGTQPYTFVLDVRPTSGASSWTYLLRVRSVSGGTYQASFNHAGNISNVTAGCAAQVIDMGGYSRIALTVPVPAARTLYDAPHGANSNVDIRHPAIFPGSLSAQEITNLF